MKKPALSVITPIYNGEDFIERCYNSLVLQTFQDWEWVVVDDGSNDATLEKAGKIADNNSRVRIFSYKPNKGRGFARTKAINESQGKWVVVWDVDDMYFQDRLVTINDARINGYDFFCSYTVVVDNKFKIKGVRGFFPVSDGLPRSFVHPTMACKTAIAKKIGYNFKIRTGEDAKIIWTLSAKYKGKWLEDALVIYFEDSEVNLKKAIACNLGHVLQLKEMFKENILNSTTNYIILRLKYGLKLVILNLMRLYPSLYLKFVTDRSFGKIKSDWNLSQGRADFIKKLEGYCIGNKKNNEISRKIN